MKDSRHGMSFIVKHFTRNEIVINLFITILSLSIFFFLWSALYQLDNNPDLQYYDCSGRLFTCHLVNLSIPILKIIADGKPYVTMKCDFYSKIWCNYQHFTLLFVWFTSFLTLVCIPMIWYLNRKSSVNSMETIS